MSDEAPAEETQEAAPEESNTVNYDTFSKLELRVANVLEAREHPNANRLLLLQIQVGDVKKQIVAGIKGHYDLDDLVGRQIIVVNNLERAMIRGEESEGMLLAASDGDAVVLLRPDREVINGAGIK